MPILTVALVLSTGLSTVALVAASYAVWKARRLTRWQEWPYQEIAALQAAQDEHAVQLTQHHERLRKVNARLAARDRRSTKVSADDTQDPELEPDRGASVSSDTTRLPGEDDLAYKKRMRLLIAQGKLGHGG